MSWPSRAMARAVVLSLALTVAGMAAGAMSAPAAPATTAGYPDGGGRANAGRPPATGLAPRDVTPPTQPAGYPVTGIDVASWNHPDNAPIDWAGVAAGGYRFAYVKATENTDYTNPYFADDLREAKANGAATTSPSHRCRPGCTPSSTACSSTSAAHR